MDQVIMSMAQTGYSLYLSKFYFGSSWAEVLMEPNTSRLISQQLRD